MDLAPYRVEAWHFDMVGESLPADIIRVGEEELGSSGAAGVAELLQEVAGIQFREVTGNGTVGQLSLRGFGDNSGLRVLVLVDGQAYNPPDMGGINWLGMEIGDLESVEVIRGGQSVLYGNHAVSGVVKLVTKFPGEGSEGSLGGQVGSDGRRRAGAGWGQALGPIGLRMGVHWEESDGYRENSAYESHAANLAVRAKAAETVTWDGRLNWNWNEVYFPGPLEYWQMLEDPRQSTNDGTERSINESLLATVKGEGQEDWGNWQFQAGHLDREQDWNLGGRIADNGLERWNVSPRVQMGDKERFIIGGVDLQLDGLDYTEYLKQEKQTVRSWTDLDRRTLGGYLFGSIPLTDKLALSGGIRFEEAKTENLNVHYREDQLLPELETNRGTIPNPNYRNPPEIDPEKSFDGPVDKSGYAGELSLMSKVSDEMNVWAGWDRVYRYPSLDETAAFQGFPLSEPLNSDLDPETGNNFELGIKRFANNWHLSLTGFLMILDDEIIYDDSLKLNTNIGETQRHGAELDISFQRAGYGVNARTAWTVAKLGENTPAKGKTIPLVSEFNTVATFWVQPIARWRLQLHGSYQSSQYQGNDFDNISRKIPAYGLLGFSIRWEASEHLSLIFNLSNLLDEYYASTAYNGGFYPGSGRQFLFRATLSF